MRSFPSLRAAVLLLCLGGCLPPAPAPTDAGTTSDASLPPEPDAGVLDLIDTDCDGLSDVEEWSLRYPGDGATHPNDWDTDKDGLRDGLEVGRTSTPNTQSLCTRLFVADADTTSRTNPTRADTDGDGLLDGVEDANHNGRQDPGETDPIRDDTDGDGLSDYVESKVGGTDPLNADTDGDTCVDGVEDRNGNGVVDPGETDPKVGTDCGRGLPPQDVDTDADGLVDTLEKATGTDWLNPDTDGDGLRDGLEDRDHDGQVDPGETNPRSKDSDCDGLVDGPALGGFSGEDLNASGGRDSNETDPAQRDTDGDGLLDGLERGVATNRAPLGTCGYAGDQDPATTTNPLQADSDGDGLSDGVEDANRNGRVDSGETDPLDPLNGGGSSGPEGQACAAPNLRQVVFKDDSGSDIRLALRPTFQEVKPLTVGGTSRGFIGYDSTNKVAFIAYKRGQAGSSTTAAGDEIYVRGQLNPTTIETTQTFTTWDGFPALKAFYENSTTTHLAAYAQQVANTLVGSGAGGLSGGTEVSGPFKIQAQYVHRSDSSVLVVLAITPKARFVEPGLFVMGDTAGGSALAQFGDTDAVECETFSPAVSQPTDILFVVDNSGSMASSQQALGQAANVVAARLGNSQLDWRIALVTTSYYDESYRVADRDLNTGFRGFTRDINQFKAWLQESAPCPDPSQGCWIGTGGDADEYHLTPARRAINFMTSSVAPEVKKYRPGARVVVIFFTDVRDESTDNNSDNSSKNTLQQFVDYFRSGNPTGQAIQLHGILCDPAESSSLCAAGESITNPVHKDAIQALGGVVGSIRTATGIQTAINGILDGITGGAGPRILKPFIGASVRVALSAVRDPSRCNPNDLPRSRIDGFDVEDTGRVLSFHGSCRPPDTGTTRGALSYRTWRDLTSGPNGPSSLAPGGGGPFPGAEARSAP